MSATKNEVELYEALENCSVHEREQVIIRFHEHIEPDHLTALEALISGLSAYVKSKKNPGG